MLSAIPWTTLAAHTDADLGKTRMDRSKTRYLLALGLGIGTAVLIYLAESALGINGEENVLTKRMEMAVFGVGLVGALAARFRAGGMAWAMFAAAVAQACAGVMAIAAGLHQGPGFVDIVGVNGLFASMFAASGLLFRTSARAACPPADPELPLVS